MNETSPVSDIKNTTKEVLSFFKLYFTNPLLAVKKCPDWNLKTILVVQVIFGMITGFVHDLFSKSFITLLKGIIIFPISSILTTFLGAAFFYFLFILIRDRQLPFLKLYTLVFLAHIPFLILRLLNTFVAPIDLVGFAATTILLAIGFVEIFGFNKKNMIRLCGGIFVAYFIIWSLQQYFSQKENLRFKKESQTENIHSIENLDIIEKEINDTF